ncbi:MAG: hypothetical protein WC679_01870 [Bacteroidales bacterium]|jgi:hypothetical protein
MTQKIPKPCKYIKYDDIEYRDGYGTKCEYCGHPPSSPCGKHSVEQSVLAAYFYGSLVKSQIPFAEHLLLNGVVPHKTGEIEYPIPKIAKYYKSCETCKLSTQFLTNCKFKKLRTKCGPLLPYWKISKSALDKHIAENFQ